VRHSHWASQYNKCSVYWTTTRKKKKRRQPFTDERLIKKDRLVFFFMPMYNSTCNLWLLHHISSTRRCHYRSCHCRVSSRLLYISRIYCSYKCKLYNFNISQWYWSIDNIFFGRTTYDVDKYCTYFSFKCKLLWINFVIKNVKYRFGLKNWSTFFFCRQKKKCSWFWLEQANRC
jgi:hypothetical protein